MRITLFGLAAIAIIGAIIVFVGPLFISTDDLRNSLFAQVESTTGYRLRVSGHVQISLFPSLDLVAEDVGIAKSGAAATSETATAKSLRFGLQLSALIGGKVKMTEVTLIDPVIAVPQTQPAGKARGMQFPQADPGSAAASLRSLSLDKLLIKNGTLILPGLPARRQRIEALNLEASMPAPHATLAFDGSASLDGQKIHVAGSIVGLAQLLDGQTVPVSFDIAAPAYLEQKAALTGIASYKDDGFVVSQFTARAGDKSLAGSGSYKGSLLTLHPLTLNASGNSLAGSVVADLSGANPAINAAFTGQTLNLDALLSQPGATPSAASGSGGSGRDRLERCQNRFLGAQGRYRQLKLSAAQLVYNNIKIGNATLQATISGGKLLHRCRASSFMAARARRRSMSMRSGKIAAQRIRLTLANFDALLSSRTVRALRASKAPARSPSTSTRNGASQRAIVAALSGSASSSSATVRSAALTSPRPCAG